ncbi:MAG: YajQ family cyclic di-GMP-binding protein [bacterium]|nr:YajQ family cyclic di-GMP-binding protein [bacterium]
MATFSFDITSDYDKSEMSNVFLQAEKELGSRYDLKGSKAAIEWMPDKQGFEVTADNDWQLEQVVDIIRKKLSSRNMSSKVLDLDGTLNTSNMKVTQKIPFVSGLDQDKAKKITKLIRDNYPKAKSQIQSDSVRVTSASKNDLQAIMKLIDEQDFDFVTNYGNFR